MAHPPVYQYVTVLLILMCHGAFGQDLTQNTTRSAETLNHDSKHRLFAEVGGRTLVFGSVNYQYTLGKNFAVGAGLGLANVQSGTISRVTNGNPETGDYLELATSQMIFGNYFVGGDRHKLLLTAGLTNFLISGRNKYPSETVRFLDSQVEWNAGIGYHLELNKLFLRVTAYCLSLPDPTGWFPKYIPWAGVTAGLKL